MARKVEEVMEREGTMMARSSLQQTAIRAITIALSNYLLCSLIGLAHCSRHCHETYVRYTQTISSHSLKVEHFVLRECAEEVVFVHIQLCIYRLCWLLAQALSKNVSSRLSISTLLYPLNINIVILKQQKSVKIE